MNHGWVGMTPEGDVAIAVRLGWLMVELELRGVARNGQGHPDRSDLPTLSDLDIWEITAINLTAVEVALHQLGLVLSDLGLSAPPLEDLQKACDGTSTEESKNTGTRAAIPIAVHALHDSLLRLLHAADFGLGQAYDLGRALAYTALKPEDSETLRKQFSRYRLPNLQAWLADLATALPPHAARAVAISLDTWRQAVPEPIMPPDDDGASARLHTATTDQGGLQPLPSPVTTRLHRQGELWRALLTGEKAGADMLGPKDYIDAAFRLMVQTGALIREVLARPAVRWTLAGATLIPLGVVAALLVFVPQPAAKVTGSIVAVATAFGVSWSTVRSTVGRALQRAEQPLWHAELDTAIAEAITVLPSSAEVALLVPAGEPPPTVLNTVQTAERLEPHGPNESDR